MERLRTILADIATAIKSINNSSVINAQDFTKNILLIAFPSLTESMVDVSGNGVTVIKKLTIDGEVKTVKSNAFKSTDIISVEFKEGVETIKATAFYECKKLTSIKFSDTVTTIEGNAFQYCRALESVTIPASVVSIGAAFNGCNKLTILEVASDNPRYSSDGNNIIYEKSEKMVVQLTPASTIPDEAEIIGKSAGYALLVKSITLPENITTIEQMAFYLSKVEEFIFAGSNITNIAPQAFGNCGNLRSFDMPDSVSSIGMFIFSGDTSLEDITISKNLTGISQSCFSGCKKLTDVTFNHGSILKSIGSSAFNGCTSLERIVIPNTKGSDGYSIFDTISNYAFMDCTNFRVLDMSTLVKDTTLDETNTNIPKLGTNAFDGCHADLEILVPVGWKNTMLKMTNWSDVANKIVEVEPNN